MIKIKNIYSVPSIHYSPHFAKVVRDYFFQIKPDVIAIELPSNCKTTVINAVKELPQLTAVYSNAHSNYFSFIPILPTDSIIEAIRIGIENNIPVEFIDLNIDVNIPKTTDMLLDEVAIETIGIKKYYKELKPVFETRQDIKENLMREELMCFHLNNLSKKYKKVLFVCGMAHWENIKKFLIQKNKFHNHKTNVKYEIANLDLKLLEFKFGIFPYHVYLYELFRAKNEYEWLKVIHTLYKNSDKNNQMQISDMKNIIQYARNQAILENRISPDLYHIVLSAKQFADDEYGWNVLKLARKYPLQKKYKFENMKFNAKTGMLSIKGKKKKIKLINPNYSEYKTLQFKRLTTIKFNRRIREHPESDSKGKAFDISNWGRYGDEMKRETEFIFYLEKRWNEINGSEDDYETFEFSGGLIDGIDHRSMIKDFTGNKIYVKEDINKYVDFSLILFEFITPEVKLNDNEIDYCYQFGKIPKMYHNAFGITGNFKKYNNGTGSFDWWTIASFKKEKNVDYAIECSDDVYYAYQKKRFGNLLETVRHIAIMKSPGRNILFVTEKPVSQDVKLTAMIAKKKIYWLPKNKVNSNLIKKNHRFNIYFKTLLF